ncbi:MAG: site-specific integrase [Deltaproteobacteria bacterium]|jgi:integrase|nr:site-specific integrase [Deltaproteobacteria bacterium]
MEKSAYKIKVIVASSGERFRALVNADGTLHYYGNLYANMNLRTRNRAGHTVENALRAIVILYHFLDSANIQLEHRMLAGNFLSRPELENLNRVSRFPISDITALTAPQHSPNKKTIQFTPFRKKVVPHNVSDEISKKTATLRQIYIKDYLLWLLEWFSHHKTSDRLKSFEWARTMTQRVLSSFSTDGAKRGVTIRQGLSQESQDELFRIIDLCSQDNPWKHHFCRTRNELLIKLLFYLGVRRGELLALQVRDVNFSENKILIARRPDNPEDSRKYQPLVKTLERSLPLEDALGERLYGYIHNCRRKTQHAKYHPFLLVSSIGDPFSISGLSHVCEEIKAVNPHLLSNFSPHLLRHTWNDRFSRIMKEEGVPPDREQYLRCILMGWIPTSEMAAVYTRRYVIEEAQKISLQMQKEAINLGRKND